MDGMKSLKFIREGKMFLPKLLSARTEESGRLFGTIHGSRKS